jgi:hypothetical protein
MGSAAHGPRRSGPCWTLQSFVCGCREGVGLRTSERRAASSPDPSPFHVCIAAELLFYTTRRGQRPADMRLSAETAPVSEIVKLNLACA